MKTIYQCDQCDFQSVNRYHCIQHKEAIHELVKNLCDQYDFQNRIPKCLKNGIKRVKQDKIRHQCRKCNSSYVYRSSLSIHIKTKQFLKIFYWPLVNHICYLTLPQNLAPLLATNPSITVCRMTNLSPLPACSYVI
jgi:hypothetical protein